MSETVSPFTLDHLAAILDEDGVDYQRSQHQPILLANFCCDHVPHALRFVVNQERGYLSIAQHDLISLSTRVATASRIGEACRFALLANGEALYGGFMLYGYHASSIGYCAIVPTAGALLSSEQVRTALFGVCREVDLAYPLLQQVLWGRLAPEEAQGFYRRRAEEYARTDTTPISGDDSLENTTTEDSLSEQGENQVRPWSRQEIRDQAFAFEVKQGTLFHPECTTEKQREVSGSLSAGFCSGAFYLPAGETELGWPIAFDTIPLCMVCQRPIVAPSQQS